MDWFVFPIFLCASLAAGAAGAMFVPGEWYRSLTKPNWTPPDWVFPVTWTVLYVLMSVAASRAATFPDSQYVLAFWALQITLNGLWSPVFFGLRRIRAGMIVIVALWLSVLATLVMMSRLDAVAALMFVPYLVWVSIAAALNFSIMRSNPDATAQAG